MVEGSAHARPSEFLGTERFIVDREMGAGGMGIVYSVFDRELDAHVALKLLRRVDPMGLFRFKREFRSLANLAHRNLVTLYELVAYQDSWFFTMEMVPGCTFLQYVRHGAARPSGTDGGDTVDTVDASPKSQPAPSTGTLQPAADPTTVGTSVSRAPRGPVSHRASGTRAEPLSQPAQFERLRASVRQLVSGLSALHDAGHLHRDVKPSNVLVTPNDRVVLLDFGVVTQLGGHGMDEGLLVGTPAYMAPEQAIGAEPQPASDWYAVGVMLYEALAGRRPFEGDAREVLTAKRHLDAPSLRPYDSIPPDLIDACEGLLIRDPDARMDGEALSRVLDSTTAPKRARALAPFPVSDDEPFVGRESHLRILSDCFDALAADQARSVFVTGRSGSGKSSLCEYFLEHISTTGEALVLTGRCYEQESVPYKALDSLVDELTQHLVSMSSADVRAIMPRGIKALARLFPVLNRVPAIEDASTQVLETPDPHELRMRGFTALRRLLTRLADRRPLILYVDDVQWADAESGELLSEVMRPPDPPVLLLLASMRSEALQTSEFLQAVRRAHKGSDTSDAIVELPVADLSRTDAALLAQRLMERAGATAQLSERADQIAAESGGNPFFILELARLAALPRNADTPARDLTLDGLMQARVDELDDDARNLLHVISLAARPVPQAAAREAAGLEDADASALVRLRNARLIRSVAGTTGSAAIETYHARIRESVVDQLDPQVRTELHARLAVALEHNNGDAQTLAAHFEAAGDDRRASHYYEVAAKLARETLAFDRAAELYTRSLALHPQDSVELYTALADTLADAGRGRNAADAYLTAAKLSEGDDRLECERRAADQLLRVGYIEEGIATLDRVLRHVGATMPRSRRRALASVVWGRLKLKLRGTRWRETAAQDVAQEDKRRLEVFQAVAKSLAVVDTVRGADFQSRGLLLALRVGERTRVARALALEGGYVATQGSHRKARQMIAKGLELASQCDDAHTQALALTIDGIVRYLACDYIAGVRKLAEGEQLFLDRTTGTAWEVNTARLARLWALRFLGAHVEMRRSFDHYLRDAKRRGDRYVETTMRRLCSELWLVQDHPAGARENLGKATWMPPDGTFHLQHWYELRALAEIGLYEGHGPRALQAAEPLLAQLSSSLLFRVQIVRAESYWLHARLLLAAANESPEPAALIRRAAKLARRIHREPIPCAQIWATMLDAALAARRGEDDRARALLEDAGNLAVETNMLLLAAAAQRCRGLLIGGDEGNNLIAAADDWMQRDRIRNPRAMAQMVLPCVPD